MRGHTQDEGLAVERPCGRPAVACAMDAAVAQPRVPAVRAHPGRSGQRLVHVLPVAHEEAVSTEHPLHSMRSGCGQGWEEARVSDNLAH